MTIREYVLENLHAWEPQTVAQLRKRINDRIRDRLGWSNQPPPTNDANLSSLLLKMVRARQIKRIEGFGPRDGYGYMRGRQKDLP